MTWDRRLYFPSEGRRAEDFFTLKNRMALAGFEPANLGTKGQHTTPRPPKPLSQSLYLLCFLGHAAKSPFFSSIKCCVFYEVCFCSWSIHILLEECAEI